MKKLIPVIFIFIASCSGGGNMPDKEHIPTNDLAKRTIRGKVSSILEISYSPVQEAGEIQKGEKTDTTASTFNEKGNLVEQSSYLLSRNFSVPRVTLKYDDKGNLVEKHTYKDGSGNLTTKNVYSYDDAGNQTEDNEFNADGSLNGRTTYKYNSKHYKTESKSYRADGSLWDKNSYSYDSNGNLIIDKSFDSGGSLDSRKTMKYDDKGKIIEEFNEQPRISLKINGKKVSGDNKLTYKYDNNGNVTEMIFTGGNDKEEKHSYKYDYDKGLNWTKRIEYVNSVPYEIKERVIEYF